MKKWLMGAYELVAGGIYLLLVELWVVMKLLRLFGFHTDSHCVLFVAFSVFYKLCSIHIIGECGNSCDCVEEGSYSIIYLQKISDIICYNIPYLIY